MPWCSLYYNASKYSLQITKSRYKACLYSALGVVLFLFFVLYFTLYYLFSLGIVSTGIIFIGAYLANVDRDKSASKSAFYLDMKGEITFQRNCPFLAHCFQLEANTLVQSVLKLQAHSRVGFLGCWLVLACKQEHFSQGLPQRKKNKPYTIFIFKDSFSPQDFSRLTRIIKNISA